MRQSFGKFVELGREIFGPCASAVGERCGRFRLAKPPAKQTLCILVSDAGDWPELFGLSSLPWEHVSVSAQGRCPTWEEMHWVKSLFFEPEECVIQFHPPASVYVNNHPFCLHLWKPVGFVIPLPPTECVGIIGGS